MPPPKKPEPAVESNDGGMMEGFEFTIDPGTADIGKVEVSSFIERTAYEEEPAPRDRRPAPRPPQKQPSGPAPQRPTGPGPKRPVAGRPAPSGPRRPGPPKPPAPQPEQSDDGSLLGMMEDMNEAVGRGFAEYNNPTQQPAAGAPFDLMQREEPKPAPKRTRPEPDIILEQDDSTEIIMARIKRGRLINRLLTRVFPQVVILSLVILFGIPFVEGLLFQGIWHGELTDTEGRTAEFELKLDRKGNQVFGSVYFFRPDGESVLTPVAKSKVSKVVLQIISGERGTVDGVFDAETAQFKITPEQGVIGSSIDFTGEFEHKDRLVGSVANSFQNQGSYYLERVRY